LVGVSQRIIDKELAKKKEEYLNNEELAQIAKQYESNKVISVLFILMKKKIHGLLQVDNYQ